MNQTQKDGAHFTTHASKLGNILKDSCCTGDGISSRGDGWIGNIYLILISKAVFLRISILKACALTRGVDQLGNERMYNSCTRGRLTPSRIVVVLVDQL